MFSNQKLALLLFAARAAGIPLKHESEMEKHLWGMQNEEGGIAALSYPSGEKAGSANAETTALTLLIYNDNALSKSPRAQPANWTIPPGVVSLAALVGLGFITGLYAWASKIRKNKSRQ